MRVSADVKLATRRRILDACKRLFLGEGFRAATTRDIARAAGIANGTLFNYFASKDAIATALAVEDLAEARGRFARRRRSGSLEEDLFALIAEELRALRPHRSYLQPVLETALRPPVSSDPGGEGDVIRADHLRVIDRLLADHGQVMPPSFVTQHLYWTLYTGVLAFWAVDPSPAQEDTLAVLDQSLRAFVGALPPGGDR